MTSKVPLKIEGRGSKVTCSKGHYGKKYNQKSKIFYALGCLTNNKYAEEARFIFRDQNGFRPKSLKARNAELGGLMVN